MSLSDAFVRAAKPSTDKDYKVADGGGLYLLVSKGGGKLWRVRYRFASVEKLLSLGAYPEVGLKEARLRRDEAKRLIANGLDPSFEKKRKAITASLQANNTFKGVAREYIEKLEVDSIAEATSKKTNWLLSLLENALNGILIA